MSAPLKSKLAGKKIGLWFLLLFMSLSVGALFFGDLRGRFQPVGLWPVLATPGVALLAGLGRRCRGQEHDA